MAIATKKYCLPCGTTGYLHYTQMIRQQNDKYYYTVLYLLCAIANNLLLLTCCVHPQSQLVGDGGVEVIICSSDGITDTVQRNLPPELFVVAKRPKASILFLH